MAVSPVCGRQAARISKVIGRLRNGHAEEHLAVTLSVIRDEIKITFHDGLSSNNAHEDTHEEVLKRGRKHAALNYI